MLFISITEEIAIVTVLVTIQLILQSLFMEVLHIDFSFDRYIKSKYYIQH